MNSVDFAGSNTTFTAPKGEEDEVQDLKAYADGRRIVSCWELDDEELLEIIRTRRVYLSILGKMQPPVKLDAQKSTDEAREVPPATLKQREQFLIALVEEAVSEEGRDLAGLKLLLRRGLDNLPEERTQT